MGDEGGLIEKGAYELSSPEKGGLNIGFTVIRAPG